jgi:hypothetical protein
LSREDSKRCSVEGNNIFLLLFVIFVGILVSSLVVTAPVQAQKFNPGTTTEGERATVRDPATPPTHKVRVEFKGILVGDNHEGDWDGVGDGEFDLVAYVQGKKVDLVLLNPGLWDIDEGYLTFSPSTAIDVFLSENAPLSIFTVGWEIDGCRKNVWPADVKEVYPILYTPQDVSSWLSSIDGVRQEVNDNSAITVGCGWPSSSYESNRLGSINEIFLPTDYPHPVSRTLITNTMDFALDVAITDCVTDATCPPIPPPEGTGAAGNGGPDHCNSMLGCKPN